MAVATVRVIDAVGGCGARGDPRDFGGLGPVSPEGSDRASGAAPPDVELKAVKKSPERVTGGGCRAGGARGGRSPLRPNGAAVASPDVELKAVKKSPERVTGGGCRGGAAVAPPDVY
jgi:hypothetical protein